MGYSRLNVHELEGAGPGGAVRFVRRQLGVEAFGINWFELGPNVVGHEHDETGSGGAVRFVRRELGVEAFGINWFELPPSTEGHEHDESQSGQEEVNVIVRGSGVYRIDGEEVQVQEGDFLRFDPQTTRCPVAGPDGMTLIAVGSPPGAYVPRGLF